MRTKAIQRRSCLQLRRPRPAKRQDHERLQDVRRRPGHAAVDGVGAAQHAAHGRARDPGVRLPMHDLVEVGRQPAAPEARAPRAGPAASVRRKLGGARPCAHHQPSIRTLAPIGRNTAVLCARSATAVPSTYASHAQPVARRLTDRSGCAQQVGDAQHRHRRSEA